MPSDLREFGVMKEQLDFQAGQEHRESQAWTVGQESRGYRAAMEARVRSVRKVLTVFTADEDPVDHAETMDPRVSLATAA